MKRTVKQTRRRRAEKSRQMMSMVHLLIAVVALLECVLLIAFTTFSWIESSSSLIISSGKNGRERMTVSGNLNYQVHIAMDSAGHAELASNDIDDGFIHTARYFNFAKASSKDGSHFFFPKDSDNYRAGDTADYNTAYIYADFELQNSTMTTRDFRFDSADIFEVTGVSDATLRGYIEGAMRISVQKGTADAAIFANASNSTYAVYAAPDYFNSYTPHTISDYVYDEDVARDIIFSSEGASGEVTDHISIRVWFECNDPVYLANKTEVDAVLSKATINVDFNLINDKAAYDRIYFDDYAFSIASTSLGSYVTMEDSAAYAMYLYTYNTSVGDWISYRMSPMSNVASVGRRWVATVPLDYSVVDVLDAVDTDYFSDSYFYYGTTAGPSSARYKWDLPAPLTVVNDFEGNPESIGNNHIRNLGVVKDTSGSTPIEGFAQLQSDEDAMTLFYFKDYATAFTGVDYNRDSVDTPSIGYLSQSISEVTSSETVYQYEVPDDAKTIIFNNGNSGSSNQTVDVEEIIDGACYYCLDETSDVGSYKVSTLTVSGSALPTKGSGGKYIYFVNRKWIGSTPTLYYYTNTGANNTWPGVTMSTYRDATGTYEVTRKSNLFVNCSATGGTAKGSVSLYYDASDKIFKAYIPMSWLTGGDMVVHYNKTGTYSEANDILRFSTGAGVPVNSVYTYTALGYSQSALLSSFGSGTVGTGIGTWSNVRKISFSTELIDSDISAAYAYRIGYSTDSGTTYNDYPMYPDSLGLTYTGYIPKPADTDTITGLYRFTRYAAQTSATATGFWYPQGSITTSDKTFYALDAAAVEANAKHESRGMFHVAVLTDGTYENLVKDTVLGNDASAGALLAYSVDGGAYTTIAQCTTPGSTYTDTCRLGDRRWYVPCSAGSVVSFKWVPYPAVGTVPETAFYYSVNTAAGIYAVVSEGN